MSWSRFTCRLVPFGPSRMDDRTKTCELPRANAPLRSNERQISRLAAFADRLGFVAGAGPAGVRRRVVLVRGGRRECRMLGAGLQGPADVAVDVRGEAEQAAGLEHPREAVEIDRADEAALPVPALRPR